MYKLCFYLVDSQYVQHLKQHEISQRGFSRVPNVEYEQGRKPKFLCGVVLQVNGFDYFVPVSSYKIKQPDNFVIRVHDKVVSSLRFNYMIPCPQDTLKMRDFTAEPDLKYRLLLVNELDYCRKHQAQICRAAERTYFRVTQKLNVNLVKNSCDFRLLEHACLEYTERQSQKKQLSFTERLAAAKDKASAATSQQKQLPLKKDVSGREQS